MNARTIQRAKLARKFGIGLMLAGLAPIAWLVAGSLNPAMARLPSFGALAPLHRVPWMPHPAWVLFALASLAVMCLGATIVARQNAVFETDKRETEDRLRRVREYGGDERIEPYIGSPITLEQDREPS
jgi:hypothetical protein